MALKGAGQHAIQMAADYRREFKRDSMSAKWFDSWDDVPKGRLDYVPMSSKYEESNRVFVIFSYKTPIAWAFEDEPLWAIPDQWYSRTTTNHQNVVRVAVENYAFYR